MNRKQDLLTNITFILPKDSAKPETQVCFQTVTEAKKEPHFSIHPSVLMLCPSSCGASVLPNTSPDLLDAQLKSTDCSLLRYFAMGEECGRDP